MLLFDLLDSFNRPELLLDYRAVVNKCPTERVSLYLSLVPMVKMGADKSY